MYGSSRGRAGGPVQREPSPASLGPMDAVPGFVALLPVLAISARAQEAAPAGFTALFDGSSLRGWHGQKHFDPDQLQAMSSEARARMRGEDDATVPLHWRVEAGEVVNDGDGAFLTTDREY